ncbi:MAG: MFS transporter, partial [Candidatus Thorarchaeota archaeon]
MKQFVWLSKNHILFYLVLFAGTFAVSTIIPNITKIEIYYNFNYLGIIESIFIFISTISLIFWGYASDKHSRRNLIILGSFIVSIACILIIYSYSIEYYAFSRFLM